MVSHIHYNSNANKDFVISFPFKLVTCFIDIHSYAFDFTLGMKSQSIAYLLKKISLDTEFEIFNMKCTQ